MKVFKSILSVLFLIGLLCATAQPVKAVDNDWVLLSANEQAASGFTHRIHLYATNCVSLRTNGVNSLFPILYSSNITFSAGTRVRNVAVKVANGFTTSGGTVTACAMQIGDGAVTNRFLTGAAVGTNTAAGTWIAGNWTNQIYTASTNISINLVTTGDFLTGFTTGDLWIYVNAVDLDDFAN